MVTDKISKPRIPGNFYTLKGYSLLEHNQVTTSMEDYLEMIYRLRTDAGPVRIKDLAENLHVKPSSASKMVSNLKSCGFAAFEKYGLILLTEKGLSLGEYLLFRHEVLNRFFCFLNETEDELEQVEKIEHFVDYRTVRNLEQFLNTCPICRK